MEFLDDFANHNSAANPGAGSAENGFANEDWLDMALGITGSQDDWLLALENTDHIFNDDKPNKLAEKNGLGKGSLLRAAFSTGDLQSLANSSSDFSPAWAPLANSSNRLESVPENSATNGGPLAAFHSNPTPQQSTNQFPSPAAPPAKSPGSPPATSSSDPLENLSIEQLEAQLSLAQQNITTSPLPNPQFDPPNPFVEPLTLPFPAPTESAASSSTTTAPNAAAATSAVSVLPHIKQSPSSQDLAALAAAAAPTSQPIMSPAPTPMDPNMPPPNPQLPFLMPGAMPQGQMQYNPMMQPMGAPGAPPLPSLPTQAPQLQPPSLPTLARPPAQQGQPQHQPQASQPQHQPQHQHQHQPMGPVQPQMGGMPAMPMGQMPGGPGGAQVAANGMLPPPQGMPGFTQPQAFPAAAMGPPGTMPMDFTQQMQHRPQMPMFPGGPLPPPPPYPDMTRQPSDPSLAMQPPLHPHQPPPHMHPHHPHPHPHPHPHAHPLAPAPTMHGLPNPPLSPPDAPSLLSRPMGGLRKSHSCVELASWRTNSASSMDLTDLASKAPVGKLTPEERALKLLRYRQKRNERNFNRTIKYQCRKTLADTRPRVRGRFARNNDPESVPPELTKKALRERAKTDVGDVGVKMEEGGPEGGYEGGYGGGLVLVHAQASGDPSASGGSAPGGPQQSSSVGTATTSTEDSLELPSFSDPMAMMVDSAVSSAPYDYLQGASSAPPVHASQPMQLQLQQQHQLPPPQHQHQQHPTLYSHFPAFPTAPNPSP